MKTLTITLLSIIFGSISVFSQSENLNHSIESNANGKPLRIVSTTTQTQQPVIRNEYTYNSNGLRESKTLYLWNEKKNDWEKRHRTQYFYNSDRQLVFTTLTHWDNKKNVWSKKNISMVYNYDTAGNFLAVRHIKSEHIEAKHLANK